MSWDRIRRVIVVTVAVLAAAPAAAQAVVTVNTTSDPGGSGCTGGVCSLRQAIAVAASGDTINFAPGVTGTITLTGGVLSVTQSLIINGPGAGVLTINGNGNTSFDVAPSVGNPDVTLSGLTITGGTGTTSGGGILAAGTLRTLTLSGDTITGNQITLGAADNGGGGGVYVGGAALVVTGSTITNNSVSISGGTSRNNGGGGIYSAGGDVTITGSDVSHNSVDQASSSGDSGGGGIYSAGGTVEVDSSTVLDDSYHITSDTFGDDGGGGIYSAGGAADLNSSTVNGNSFTMGSSTGSDSGGGGVYSAGGDVTVAFSSIDGNTLTLQNETGGGNDGGAGLASEGGNIGVAFSSISGNTGTITDTGSDDGGGAILDEGGANVYLTSTFSGNSMTISGGGNNNGGGAIYAFGSSQISSLTIAGNHVNAPGGAFLNRGSAQITNTIIAGNTATPAGNCAGTGTFTSAGFNLESANSCGFNAGGDLINTDPGLGALQNNGGPTATQALPIGSPAVDAGTCSGLSGQPLIVDQRGVSRPQPAGGKCDIGAFELVPGSAPPPSPPATVPGTPAATSSTGASFSATVNPNGQATTVSFQYGIDSRYRPGGGSAVIYDQSTPPQTLPADTAAHAVSGSATGLVPNALYHVRLVATNATGTTFGPDQTFTTPAAPAPPPPVLGQSVNAKPVSGQVFILVAGKLVPLTQAQKIPSGAILDTRAGSLQLTAAAGGGGHKTETGVFGGAVFKLTQAHNGLTNLSLAEGAVPGAPSYATCKAHKAGEASAATTKTLQLLHASAHGKFRTTGRYSAATVRGTTWTIADRCDGTLTHDITHSIAVNDFVRHKTIILHAGQTYLARARSVR